MNVPFGSTSLAASLEQDGFHHQEVRLV